MRMCESCGLFRSVQSIGRCRASVSRGIHTVAPFIESGMEALERWKIPAEEKRGTKAVKQELEPVTRSEPLAHRIERE
jgi:hypothetical protein